MKYLIYIVAIDDPNSKVLVNEYFQYALPTWEHYCNRYGIDLKVERTWFNKQITKPIWHKESIHEIGYGYDKIGIVDSDTMVRWDAPNIFEQFTDQFCGVNDLCDINWLLSSIDARRRFFPEVELDIFKYINAGVVFFDKKYLYIFKQLLDFYLEHQSEIDGLTSGGKEQTLLNYFLQKNDVDICLLPPSWNLLSIHRKNMFQNNWQLKVDPTPYFIKYAHIWHFTGFPIEDRVRLMKDTWTAINHMYK